MQHPVDFMFLMDGTGSMEPCMNALTGNIDIFLEELMRPQSSMIKKQLDWRAKVVTYRDHPEDEDDWFDDNPFVHRDGDGLKAQLNKLEAWGGGDEPESLLDALHKVACMEQTDQSGEADPYKWRHRSDASRVVIVFTDATYHEPMTYPEGAGGTLEDVRNVCLASNIMLLLYAPDDDHGQYEQLASINKAQWNPIPGIGDDEDKFANGLREYTDNQENFRKVIEALARTISTPIKPPPV